MATLMNFGSENNAHCDNINQNLDYLNLDGPSKLHDKNQSASAIVDSISLDIKGGKAKPQKASSAVITSDQMLMNLRRKKNKSGTVMKADEVLAVESDYEPQSDKKRAKKGKSKKKKGSQCGTKRRRKTSD